MVRCITCNVFHMRQFCRFFYCLAWFDTIEFNHLPRPNNNMYDDAIFADRFRYQLIMFGIRILIGLSRILHDHIAYEIYTAKSSPHSSEFRIVCLIWYVLIQSSAMIKQEDVLWCRFRWSIPLSTDYVRNSSTVWAILKHSCSYCIWNWYLKIHRSILPNFLLFAWFDTLEFNHLPRSSNKMCDDAVFVSRFHYQLTMFGTLVLIGLSRLLHAHIVYETDGTKWSQHFAEFLIVCMTWYSLIQSSAMFKEQDVRWCGFRL